MLPLAVGIFGKSKHPVDFECGNCGRGVAGGAAMCIHCQTPFEEGIGKCTHCASWVPLTVASWPRCKAEWRHQAPERGILAAPHVVLLPTIVSAADLERQVKEHEALKDRRKNQERLRRMRESIEAGKR